MPDDFIFYVEANFICMLAFGIMLLHDLFGVDRQEKQIKYDHALIGLIVYFISDSFWIAVERNVIPQTIVSVIIVNFANYVILSLSTYLWLRYVFAVEQTPNRDSIKRRLWILSPLIVSVLVLIVVFFAAPGLLTNEALEIQPLYNILLVIVPDGYILTILVYTFIKAHKEKNPLEKKKHLFVGLYPAGIVVFGFIQTFFFPYLPIFCFSCTLLMLIFYIQSMEDRISFDPLTKLNNRGQLQRFITQENAVAKEGKHTYVVMMDINDFKLINDNYGHSEGDKALQITAEALRMIAKNNRSISFLGRYGGDEFVLIVQELDTSRIEELVEEIRIAVMHECENARTPYMISIGIGYDEILGKEDSFQKCFQRADYKLYADKGACKARGKSTIIHF